MREYCPSCGESLDECVCEHELDEDGCCHRCGWPIDQSDPNHCVCLQVHFDEEIDEWEAEERARELAQEGTCKECGFYLDECRCN